MSTTTATAEQAEQALKKSEELIAQEAKSPQGGKKAKERLAKILGAIRQTFDVLDSVADVLPAAKPAFDLLKALIDLEEQRRDNNEQIVLLSHTMTRTLFTLTALRANEAAAEEGSEVYSQLIAQINICQGTMTEFGNFSLAYYKNKSKLVRFFRAGDFKEKLEEYANSFEECRKSISFTLQAHDSIAISTLSSDMKKVLERLGLSNDGERKAAAELEKIPGGASAVIQTGDRATLQNFATMLADRGTVEPVTTSTIETLQEDIVDMLKQNETLFAQKLNMAQKQIVQKIDDMNSAIMMQLTEGPHTLIEDLDVREVWRVNKWKLGVKCRQFVDSLYTHFAMNPRHQSSNAEVDDKWTLKVISKVINHPAIGEAIDEDASGFLSVREVDNFLRKKPEQCTTPMWLVYWAIGWRYMNEDYAIDISQMLDFVKERIEGFQDKAEAPSLAQLTMTYFLATVKKLEYVLEWMDFVDGANDGNLLADYDTTVSGKIEGLSRMISADITDRLAANLARYDYVLDDETLSSVIGEETLSNPIGEETLSSVVGETEPRIELFFMPLLFVLTERLANQFANLPEDQTEVSDSDDLIAHLEVMERNIFELLYAFTERMKSLLRSWRAQKLHTDLQIECFAGGLMYAWWKKYEGPDSKEIRDYLYDGDDSDDDDEGAGSGDKQENSRDARPPNALSFETELGGLSERVDGLDIRLARMETMLMQILAGQPLSSQASVGQVHPHIVATNDSYTDVEQRYADNGMTYGVHGGSYAFGDDPQTQGNDNDPRSNPDYGENRYSY